MCRRWIIRSFFLALLLLCMGGWGWSVGHGGYINRGYPGTLEGCSLADGTVNLWRMRDPNQAYTGWERKAYATDVHVLPPDSFKFEFMWGKYVASGGFYEWLVAFGGFKYESYCDKWASNRNSSVWVRFPCWLVMPVCSAMMLFVWRKTRPSKPGGAFPVDIRPPNRLPRPTTDQQTKAPTTNH